MEPRINVKLRVMICGFPASSRGLLKAILTALNRKPGVHCAPIASSSLNMGVDEVNPQLGDRYRPSRNYLIGEVKNPPIDGCLRQGSQYDKVIGGIK